MLYRFSPVLLGLALTAAACTDGEEIEPRTTCIRLVDRAADAVVSLAVDAESTTNVRPFFEEPLRSLAPEEAILLDAKDVKSALPAQFAERIESSGSSSFQGSGEDACLLLEPGSFYGRFMPIDQQESIRSQLQVAGRVDDATLLCVLELPRQLSVDRLRQPENMRSLVFDALDRMHRFEPDPDSTARKPWQSWTLDLRPDQETRSLLFVVASFAGPLRLRQLELLAPSAYQSLTGTADPEFSQPWVRRVGVDRDIRESILLPAPGEVRWKLVLPEHSPRLRFGLANLDLTANQTLRLTCSAAAGDRVVEHTADIVGRDRSWKEVELDISPLSGLSVELSFRASGGSTALIGAPVIEGLPGRERAMPPDIILVSMDTVRADRLSLYGFERDSSPELQRLGRDSVVFDNAIAPATWTLPSHASVFTGLLPARHQVNRMTRRVDAVSDRLLAPALRAAGYETVALTGGGFVGPRFGFASGFERYGSRDLLGVEEGDWTEDTVQRRWAELVSILRKKRRRPLFLFVHTYFAHNYNPRTEDLSALGASPDRIAALRTLFEGADQASRLDLIKSWGRDERTVEQLRLAYDACVRGSEWLVRDIAATLDQRDDTHLIVFSDHGEELFEHGRSGHGHSVYEELVHVPLLIRGPGLVPARIEQVVSLTDIAPTIRDLIGLPPDPSIDGRSLVPLLRGQTLPSSPQLAEGKGGLLYALRGERMKLIEEYEEGGSRRLFDLKQDHSETRDLATERAQLAERLATSLQERLERLRSRTMATVDSSLDPATEAELRSLGYLDVK